MKKFKKGDLIIVTTGSSKGKQGKILIVADNKVLVEGINIRTIHKKPTQQSPGEIIKKEAFINSSNIAHVLDGKPVKIGYKIDSESKKVRFIKKTGEVI